MCPLPSWHVYRSGLNAPVPTRIAAPCMTVVPLQLLAKQISKSVGASLYTQFICLVNYLQPEEKKKNIWQYKHWLRLSFFFLQILYKCYTLHHLSTHTFLEINLCSMLLFIFFFALRRHHIQGCVLSDSGCMKGKMLLGLVWVDRKMLQRRRTTEVIAAPKLRWRF